MVTVLADERIGGGSSEIIQIGWSIIGQIGVLGAAPHGLNGIQIGRICGKPFDCRPNCALLLQESCRFARHVEAIENNERLPAEMAMQVTQKSHDIGCHDVVFIRFLCGESVTYFARPMPAVRRR